MKPRKAYYFLLFPGLVVATGCPNEDGEQPTLGQCDTDGAVPPDGQWDSQVEDWSDPGAPNNESITDPCGVAGELTAHHCFTTAVHATHMHTGELFVYHGLHDQRIWPIGQGSSSMTWHPIPVYASGTNSWPDTFCSGQVPLGNGKVFLAGGNIDGSAASGGLIDTFLFDPEGAQPAGATGCAFGWETETQGATLVSAMPEMEFDRWYPTLTLLGDGRVLIAGGYSRNDPAVPPGGAAVRTRFLEVFDPTANPPTMTTLDTAPFPMSLPPSYPFMFLLPNGDVFYAGGEEAYDNADRQDGRVLVPDYNSADGTTWAWAHQVSSSIPGGSAVMYAPGKILKTGGAPGPTSAAVDGAEVVDLSDVPPGDYSSAPTAFSIAAPMNNSRHFHNLTVLPDGRVLATGGNNFSNGTPNSEEHYANPCTYQGDLLPQCEGTACDIESLDCAQGCPSVCIDRTANVTTHESCEAGPPDYECSLLRSVACDPANDTCGEVMPGAMCEGGTCSKPCTTDADCSLLMPVGGQCQVTSQQDSAKCGVENNACFAVYEAEIWDPACNTWTPLGDQDHPRMYHSTALLLPDGRVISMGGGHRDFGWAVLEEQVISEYFAPQYATDPAAQAPTFWGGDGSGFAVTTEPPFLAWDGELDVTVQNNVPATQATLVRLGATTHGFDMSQRYIPLALDGDWPMYTVHGPASLANAPARHRAPPGYYMLFLLSADGEPSLGRYVRVGDETSGSFVCEAGLGLTANERVCTAEPVGGVCPTAAARVDPVALPRVTGVSGTPVDGWHVAFQAGTIEDPSNPEPDELGEMYARCTMACEAYFADVPGQSATCDATDAFQEPAYFADEVELPLDLVREDSRHGEGLFPSQTLPCDLGVDCYTEFDEALARTVAHRVTPAETALGVGEEYRVALGSSSTATVITDKGSYSSVLTGSIGYGYCGGGNASSACPFYLGSFDALAASDITATMTCDNGKQARATLSNLVVALGQPAFGMAPAGDPNTKAFPPGALILDASFDVSRDHYTSRRTARAAVSMNASGRTFSAANLPVTLQVPCDASTATVTVVFDISDAGGAGALDSPPSVVIDTPATVPCGTTTVLSAQASDPDNDLVDVRWFVDDVLMAPELTTMTFTGAHTLRAVARDARGAATSATKVVGCQP